MAYPDLKNVLPVLEKVVSDCGVSLWGVEWTTEDGRVILRVYIEGPQGVDLGILTEVTRKMNLQLDEADPLPGAYTLEVSSPGLERRLFTLEQCSRFVGSPVKVKCRPDAPLARKRHKGLLTAVEGDDLVLDVGAKAGQKDGGEIVRLPFSQVAVAHLVYE
jgi:ribosome maturation factor RimP